MFYRPLFAWLKVPLPGDLSTFVFESVLSFTMGVGAYLVWRNPWRNVDLLKVGIVGKGLFAFSTYYFFAFNHLHWFFLVFGIWDFVFVVIFFLFLIQLQSPDLARLQRGDVFEGLPRPITRRALILAFSLTGNGRLASERLRRGLESRGYSADVRYVEALEPIFRFPMSFSDFVQIVVRAALRRSARIAPLDIPPDHPYDLVVVESQTWLLGMSAPIQALFEHAETRLIFEGRDAAALVVCRGAWRRTQAMVVRGLERSGARVVGSRGFVHEGWEPSRLFSLWLYLIYHQAGRPRWLDGLVQLHYGLSESSLREVEQLGASLADRPHADRRAA
jgi:hypothetical protein